MASASEYTLHDFGDMIRDRGRMDAYALALERTVSRGSVVLDIGAGTGIFALLAARAGAEKVFAVEPADVAELGRELAAANAAVETILFLQALSTEISLPERADVVVSDIRGVLPYYKGHIPAIVDARRRHLARGGVLIPRRDRLWAAPAELESVYDRVAFWDSQPYGLELGAGRALAANAWRRVAAPVDALLAQAAQLAELDYAFVSDPDLRSSVEMEVERSGTLHGLLVWFDSELADGVGFSNAPGEPEKIYGQAFFPLLEAVEVTSGDVVSLAFAASLFGEEYVFRWDTRVTAPHAARRVKADFVQSTLFATPVGPETLARLEDAHVPEPTDEARAVALVLDGADGRRTVGELAQDVAKRFPRRFRSNADALRFVTKVTGRYCR